jgi:hypothetical protein
MPKRHALVDDEQRPRRGVAQHDRHLSSMRLLTHTTTHITHHASVRAWCVSLMKELCATAAAMLSELAMRVKMRSVMPTVAASAGTKLPTCARKTMSATCLRYTLLPEKLGPVTTFTRPCAAPTSVSLGTKTSTVCSCSRWRPVARSTQRERSVMQHAGPLARAA